jgi:DNA-binding transcriptional LysR family regulator
MNTNIKQLEALYWAGRLGSFQAAANRLHTTQSAVSKRVAELEAGLGCKLFDRSRRRAQLTPAGERVMAGAEQMLAISRRIFDEATDPEPYQAVFRLAATELTAMSWLPALVRCIQTAHPNLRLEIEINEGGILLDRLNRNQYDLALLPGPMWGRLYEALPMKTVERCWMASPKMKLPARALTIEELSDYPIASQNPETIHAQLQSAWFHRAGFPLRNLVVAHSFGVLGQLTIAGVVLAQLPIHFYSEQLKRKELIRLSVAPELPDVQYFAVYRRSTAHRLAAQIARMAQDNCDFTKRAK